MVRHFQRLASISQVTMSSLVVMLPRGHRVKVATNPNMALLAIKVILLCFLQMSVITFQDTVLSLLQCESDCLT